MNSNDDTDTTLAPDVLRVTRRSLVLSAVICRCSSDHDPDNPDAQDLWNRLREWVESQGIDGEMESGERDLVNAQLGTLDEKDIIAAPWRTEGLALLAWSLNRFSFPQYDQQVDAYEVTDSLEFLSEDAFELVSSSNLRPATELSVCREFYYALHCRLREFARKRTPRDIGHWIEAKWLDALGIPTVLGSTGDLYIDDVPLSDVSDDAFNLCESIVCERHRAAIWLLGEEGSGYSDFPVDT
jgi:hypothetical protein